MELGKVFTYLCSPHTKRQAGTGISKNKTKPILYRTTVLSKIPHSNCSKRVPNRPLRCRRGRFGTLLQQLECEIFERTAVKIAPCHGCTFAVVSLLSTRKPRSRTGRGQTLCEHPQLPTSNRTGMYAANYSSLQPFSKKSCTATVPKVFQIGLSGVVEADLDSFTTVAVWVFWENGCMLP